jgi:hypothetical protein
MAETTTAPQLINVPAEEFARLTAAKSTYEALSAQQAADAARLAIARGEGDAVLAKARLETATIAERAKRFAADASLSQALAGHDLAPHAREQLHALLLPDIAVDENGAGYATRSRSTYEPVAAFVSKKLADPNYRHFLAANQPAPASPPAPNPAQAFLERPVNLGQEVLVRAQQAQQAQRERMATAGPANVSMALPFGLKAR